MKLSDQQKLVKSRLQLSQHTLLARLAAAIQEQLQQQLELPVRLVGKTDAGTTVSAALVGERVLTDPGDYDRSQRRLADFLDGLRNPATMQALLKG